MFFCFQWNQDTAVQNKTFVQFLRYAVDSWKRSGLVIASAQTFYIWLLLIASPGRQVETFLPNMYMQLLKFKLSASLLHQSTFSRLQITDESKDWSRKPSHISNRGEQIKASCNVLIKSLSRTWIWRDWKLSNVNQCLDLGLPKDLRQSFNCTQLLLGHVRNPVWGRGRRCILIRPFLLQAGYILRGQDKGGKTVSRYIGRGLEQQAKS